MQVLLAAVLLGNTFFQLLALLTSLVVTWSPVPELVDVQAVANWLRILPPVAHLDHLEDALQAANLPVAKNELQ